MKTKIASHRWHSTGVLCRIFVIASTLAAWTSCTNEQSDAPRFDHHGMSVAVAMTDRLDMPFDDDLNTRASINPTSSPISFAWTEGDVLAMYALEYNTGMTNFSIKQIDSQDPSKAIFQANGFNLKNGVQYAGFYPYNSSATNKTAVAVDYSESRQVSNGSYAHLGAMDYQAATATASGATEAANISLSFSHLGAVCRFRITNLPTDVRFTRLSISASGIIAKGKVDLTQSPLSIAVAGDNVALQTVLLGEADGQGINAADDGTLTVYTMMAPTDLSNTNIQLSLYTNYSNIAAYTTTVPGKNMQASKAYGYTATYSAPAGTHGYVDLGLRRADGTKILFATENYGVTQSNPNGTLVPWPSTDVVSREWGLYWRTPNKEDMEVLFNKQADGYPLTWTDTEEGTGVRATVGSDGASIFLPFSDTDNERGYYWTASQESETKAHYYKTEVNSSDEVVNSPGIISTTTQYFIRPIYIGPEM